ELEELIGAGECYQAVLSQCFTRETKADAVSLYRALRSLNPSPYMFLLNFGDKQVIGASPEMLVRCEGRKLHYRPIAGTRKRGATNAEDNALAEEMKLDKKEVSEHLMLVDLGRNDLGRVAEFGSVTVESLMHVEKYSHVQHLVSSLSATLRNDLDRFDALAACFPAGTVSGAPKVRAIEIIRGLEPTPRGIYAGAVGYFDYAGNMDTCIAIRTLVLENGVAKIQAGAGIVADSVPASEFDETVNKAKVLIRAVDIAEGRT
nr:anthranilate synthase component I family protein [Pyrinomonadaceae bacterium]